MSERLSTPHQAASNLFDTGIVQAADEASKAQLLKLATGLIGVFRLEFQKLHLHQYLDRPDALALIGPHGGDFMRVVVLQALCLTLDTDPQVEEVLINLTPQGWA